MTKLSFVVTSYNYEDYIEETLNSIKNQTFKDFEIIIVDDFSTDKSLDIINKFIFENPDLNITLISHKKNMGQLKACISGLEKASGEYISFIDSDDVLLKDYAKDLLEAHSKVNVGFISSDFEEINKNGNISKTKTTNGKIKKLNLLTSPFGGWFWNPMPTAMFKKSEIEVIKNYENVDDWKICPDKFMFNFVHLTSNSAILNKILVRKRVHSKNAGKLNRTKLNIENNKKIRKCTLDFIKKYCKKNSLQYATIIYLSYFYTPIQILKYVKKSITSKFHQK
mgnify:CR=1 FL=1